jgi:methyltransferase-like protein/SAM-dependent methyltransferase
MIHTTPAGTRPIGPDATSYDTVPYGSLAFPQTHPDRLATIARIFGLSSPDVARCRVLELGCATGANLIPMAFNLPRAEFVGIDLSQTQIERGRETLSAMGIRNATLRHASILEVDQEWGEFDYIICHGVFSWVEPHVQDKILRIANENLAADGVAYISYNTYPGWHMREMVRHMMLYHAGRFDEPKEQIEQARALLDFVASASDEMGPYGQLLRREIERLSDASDWYLYHEHLEHTNAPLYFHQFIERAEQAGLQYLGEADVSDMLTSVFPAPIAETLDRISPDILHLEQYMDFVRNRQFRQTLVCHRGPRLNRALSPAFMHGLLAASPAVTDSSTVDLSPATTVVFLNGAQHATVTLPSTKAALTILMETWPRAIAVDELTTVALERAAPFLGETPIDAARRAMMSDLFACVRCGLVQLHTGQVNCTNAVSNTPQAHPLAAYQAQAGESVINAHHKRIELDALAREVLTLANGQRDRSDIIDALMLRYENGSLGIEVGGAPVTAPDIARTVLSERLEKTLASLARSAVLVS